MRPPAAPLLLQVTLPPRAPGSATPGGTASGAVGGADFAFDRVYSQGASLFSEMVVPVLDRFFQVGGF